MKTLKTYNRKISSKLSGICEVVCDIISYLQQNYGPIDECITFELQVILNELLINAIKHGNKQDEDKYVQIIAGLTKNQSLILCVEDEGEGFDYKKLLSTASHPCCQISDIFEMGETGRGLLIVSNLCRKMRFNERGNKVCVLRKL